MRCLPDGWSLFDHVNLHPLEGGSTIFNLLISLLNLRMLILILLSLIFYMTIWSYKKCLQALKAPPISIWSFPSTKLLFFYNLLGDIIFERAHPFLFFTSSNTQKIENSPIQWSSSFYHLLVPQYNNPSSFAKIDALKTNFQDLQPPLKLNKFSVREHNFDSQNYGETLISSQIFEPFFLLFGSPQPPASMTESASVTISPLTDSATIQSLSPSLFLYPPWVRIGDILIPKFLLQLNPLLRFLYLGLFSQGQVTCRGTSISIEA